MNCLYTIRCLIIFGIIWRNDFHFFFSPLLWEKWVRFVPLLTQFFFYSSFLDFFTFICLSIILFVSSFYPPINLTIWPLILLLLFCTISKHLYILLSKHPLQQFMHLLINLSDRLEKRVWYVIDFMLWNLRKGKTIWWDNVLIIINFSSIVPQNFNQKLWEY